jgi:hypothetical protein
MLRLPLFALFLIFGITIFTIPVLLSDPISLIYRISICTIFSLILVSSYKKTYNKKYTPVLFAFFISCLVSLFDYLLYSNQSLLYWISTSRMELTVLLKILSTLLVITPIILLT